MYHSRLSGTYHEIGVKCGTALAKHGFKLPQVDEETVVLGLKCEIEVGRVFPEVLEEIRGLAEAIKEPYEKLAAFVLTVGYRKPMSCSAFASANDSTIIFGRNYDYYYRFAKYCDSYYTRPKGAYASLGNTDIFVGREDGVNEKGVAVSMHFVAAQLGTPGINFPIAVRFILDKCSNTADAINFLTQVKFLTANNYLIVDQKGEMGVVETSPTAMKVRPPETNEGFIVATNHFVHPEMAPLEDSTKRDPDSELRYNSILGSLREVRGHVTQGIAKRILSSHEGRVCAHLDYVNLGTLWSQIVDLKKSTVLRAEGQPCKTKYRPDKRLQLSTAPV